LKWVEVARAADIADGEVMRVEADGKSIALYNVGGTVCATQNICTHDFALLSEGFFEGSTIECPLHQACFDVTSGKYLSGPICADLKVFPVKVENGVVLVGLDDFNA